MPEKRKTKLRSDQWFNNPKNPDMTALYLEKYMNYGLKRKDLQSGKPIIGIAQSGSDLSPCNRHFLSLSKNKISNSYLILFKILILYLLKNLMSFTI